MKRTHARKIEGIPLYEEAEINKDIPWKYFLKFLMTHARARVIKSAKRQCTPLVNIDTRHMHTLLVGWHF